MSRSRSVFFGVLLTTLCLLSAANATPPGMVEWTDHGRGATVEAGTILVEKAKDLLVVKVTLEPGASTGWYENPGAVILVVKRGTLTRAEGARCATRTIPAGRAGLVPPGGHLLKNEGKEPVEVSTTHVGSSQGAPRPYATGEASGFPCGAETGEVSVRELGRGPFTGLWRGDGTRRLDVQKDLDVAVSEYSLGPQFSTGWHNHPGAQVAVVTRGVVTYFEAHDGHCERVDFKAGDGFMLLPGHHYRAVNQSSTDASGFVTTYVNMPRAKTAPHLDELQNHEHVPPSDGCGLVPAEEQMK